MNDERPEQLEMRVLVLAPTARDAATSREPLRGCGLPLFHLQQHRGCLPRGGARGRGGRRDRGSRPRRQVRARLAGLAQGPAAVVGLPAGRPHPNRAGVAEAPGALEAIGHMTLMKRPVQISTLVSTARSALRDRRRQYAVRDLLDERERQADALRDKEERSGSPWPASAGGLVGIGTRHRAYVPQPGRRTRRTFGRPPGRAAARTKTFRHRSTRTTASGVGEPRPAGVRERRRRLSQHTSTESPGGRRDHWSCCEDGRPFGTRTACSAVRMLVFR